MKTRIIKALFVALALCGPAAAEPRAAAPAEIFGLVGAGDFEGARAALASADHSVIDKLILEAAIAAKLGNFQDAVTIYRAIIAAAPDQIFPRQRLAEILFEIGDWDAARFQFRQLQKIDTRRGPRAAYARVLKEIDARVPYGFGTSFTLTPSTNINSGTRNQTSSEGLGTVIADEFALEESGIGLRVSAHAFLRVEGGSGAVVFRADGSASFYSDDRFNDFAPALSVAWDAKDGRKRDSYGLSVVRRWRELQTDYTEKAFFLSATRPIDPRSDLTMAFRLFDLEYDDSEPSSGVGITGTFTYFRQLSPGMAIVGDVSGVNYGASQGYASYQQPGGRIGLIRTWRGGWETYLGYEYDHRRYRDPLPLSIRRIDDIHRFTGTVLNSTFSYNGFAPKVTCSLGWTDSTIGIYDTDTAACAVNLTRSF